MSERLEKRLVEIVGQVYTTLGELDPMERRRVLKAVEVLLGEPETIMTPSPMTSSSAETRKPAGLSAAEFFAQKNPRSKMEELTIAARYRELTLKALRHSQNDLRGIIEEARRNFDVKNFVRDLDNARARGLFNRGTGRDVIILSYYGQRVVDTLPDRDSVTKIAKPRLKKPTPRPPLPLPGETK